MRRWTPAAAARWARTYGDTCRVLRCNANPGYFGMDMYSLAYELITVRGRDCIVQHATGHRCIFMNINV